MFKELKVVELSSVLAGPAVGMFFAELGAEVVKIENKLSGGDITRTWKNKNEDQSASVSAYFSSVNYGKIHLFLDLTDQTDYNKIIDLIKKADVVIVNFKPGDDLKLKLDYTTLAKINPQLIYAAITGFGTNDPRIAYDVVLQAETGFMSMNGTPESGPVKMPVALIDILAAHQTKEAILIALLKRKEDQKGSFISVSLYDTAVSSLANQASNYLMTGSVPQRIGSLHPNIAPYGETFITADKKFLVLAIGSDKQFTKLCELVGDPLLAKNEKYNSNLARVKNRRELYNELQPLFFVYRRDEIMNDMIENGIPAGAVKNMDEVFENPLTKELILSEEIDSVETKRVKTIAFRIKR